ncbi:protein THEMIS3-like isoform X2 [Rhinatrema bivittatum]|uniref:protein THEMIS3-like isoform X2 n=1 Tax=Rhinatrema bivittatum TaxID=194408 RepID=UPI00112B8B4B|nr:protein THEMIS3-like isoform X2 [Rhinatrema bivittatum]
MEQSWSSFVNSLSPDFVSRTVQVVEGNYQSGLFHLIPDPTPFATVADLIQSVRLGNSMESPPCFKSTVSFCLRKEEVQRGETFSLIGTETVVKETFLQCKLIERRASPTVQLPMNCRGMFLECHDDQHYPINTIVKWKQLAGRNRKIKPVMGYPASSHGDFIPPNFCGHLELHPVISVKAVLRGGGLPAITKTIPSDLDINVIDFIHSARQNLLVEPSPISTVYNLPEEAFPMTIKIVDLISQSEKTKHLKLKNGHVLKILRKANAQNILVSNVSPLQTRRYFLVPPTYGGMVVKEGRHFRIVYDVGLAMQEEGEIQFMASRDYVAEAPELSSFRSGDCFRAIAHRTLTFHDGGQLQHRKVLQCENILTKSTVMLPLNAEGNFEECFHDTRKCTIQELVSRNPLPCCIKVVSSDLSLASDPLSDIQILRIDSVMTEEWLVASLTDRPLDTFELYVNQESMLVRILHTNAMGSDSRKPIMQARSIEEISEQEYLLIQGPETGSHPPPPLPPKPALLACDREKLSPPAPPPPKFER